jgi:cell division protein FtsQ
MPTLTSDSRQRQRQLRRQSRLRRLAATWRTVAIAGVTGSLLWATSLPQWLLRDANQVEIRGNRLLSTQAIQALLPPLYPRVMWQIRPQQIAADLRQRAPIQSTTITRQLFPPRVIIDVQERLPVAVTECNRCVIVLHPPTARPPLPNSPNRNPAITASLLTHLQVPVADSLWLIDATGTVAPLSSYSEPQRVVPTLKISGFFTPLSAAASQTATPLITAAGGDSAVQIDPQKQTQWLSLLRILQRSPQKVFSIDWQSPNNLILKTELGVVHLGPYDPTLFAQQLKVLDQMRNLPQQYDLKQLAYIDLTDPKQPLLQKRNSPQP